jgi:dipeptidyl aminopeptidase/acylaminoacyl peptidase
MKQTPINAPNFFITKDFQDYKQLTDLQPQENYNWLSTKLISFKQLDGTQSQGVLYLPENFDPNKKYPVIISFYWRLSNRLYQYPTPAYIDAPHIYDNPAWMVSHGYLVFTPDIYFKKSEWGPSTVDAIDGAARYLKTLPYVDSNHLAATGHSNSGRFGYYLLTHSHSFAAMSIGSGNTGTDVISLGLSLDYQYNRTSNLEWAEKTAYGAGGLGNLWENKRKWIDHTAVLQADKATAPLLLFHCKKDGDDIRAAVELYIAFRRLEKPIWWLQYDKGSHVLHDKNELRDFSIRFAQFFDHYLKGARMPLWMKKGIPFKLKNIVSGYELEDE